MSISQVFSDQHLPSRIRTSQPCSFTARKHFSSLASCQARVIPFTRRKPVSLLDDPWAYVMIHIALGVALGASLILLVSAFFLGFWILRSLITILIVLSGYGGVTYYYQRLRKKTPRLFYRGLVIMGLAAAPILIGVLL